MGRRASVALLVTFAVGLGAIAASEGIEDLAERFVCVYKNLASEPVPSSIRYSWPRSPSSRHVDATPSSTNWLVDGIPFYYQLMLVECCCNRAQPGFPPCRTSDFVNLVSGVFSRLHVLTFLRNAADLPDGYVAAQLVVSYEDGDLSVLDLVTGANTAESRYDAPFYKDCLAHSRVMPALPVIAGDDAGNLFYNHLYHAAFDLKLKAIVSIEARMPTSSCEPRVGCGGAVTSDLRVVVDAMTLER